MTFFQVKALALYSRSKLPRQLHRASYGEPIKSRLNKGQIGSITASQELALIDEPSRRFSTTWSRSINSVIDAVLFRRASCRHDISQWLELAKPDSQSRLGQDSQGCRNCYLQLSGLFSRTLESATVHRRLCISALRRTNTGCCLHRQSVH